MNALPQPWSWETGAEAFVPGPTTALGDLFAHGLSRCPDRAAISDGKLEFSFRALDALAWRIAARLRALGTEPGDRVAVIAAKSALMPAVVVAIWKCGAVYAPLDADSPAARLDSLVTRLAPAAVVALERDYALGQTPVIGPRDLEALVQDPREAARWPLPARAPEDLAYIIFTSGSTGEPKGVEVTVGSLLVYFRVHNRVLRFTESSRVLSFAPFHFDVSIEDTLLPLSLGAFSYQYRGLYIGARIRNVMASQQISHMIAVSTILTLISTPLAAIGASAFPDLEMVMTGAEVCDPKIINHWVEAVPGARVINAYGPTEVTIVCLCHHIREADHARHGSFPIGLPLEEVSALLLNEAGEEAEEGELCLGGPLMMRGYLDRPDLTAGVIFERGGLRYYRSGDICRRLVDGTIQYLGRRDDEVKLNGKRIHLGELRQRAMALPGVDRAAVGLVERGGSREIALIAFSDQPAVMERLRSYLAVQLPAYMRPTVWAHGSEVTLSASGKTDEKLLLAALRAAVAAEPGQTRFTLTPEGTFTAEERINHEL